jgi:hypothetical protein
MVYFCSKFKNMTETIATATATTEQIKASILELIKENDPQFQQWLTDADFKHLDSIFFYFEHIF